MAGNAAPKFQAVFPRRLTEEIADQIGQKRLELIKVKVNLKANREKNFKKVKMLRHEISQLLTILRENEIIMKEQTDKDRPENKGNKSKETKK